MRCLTPSQIRTWLAGQGMHHQPLDCGVPEAGDFSLPSERRARLRLADHIADLLAKDGNKLIELLPSPKPADIDWDPITRFRDTAGETGPWWSSPGHLFKSRDRATFRQMVSILLGLDGGLSFYIYAAPSHTTLLIANRVEIWSTKKGPRNELGRHLEPQRAA